MMDFKHCLTRCQLPTPYGPLWLFSQTDPFSFERYQIEQFPKDIKQTAKHIKQTAKQAQSKRPEPPGHVMGVVQANAVHAPPAHKSDRIGAGAGVQQRLSALPRRRRRRRQRQRRKRRRREMWSFWGRRGQFRYRLTIVVFNN